MATYKVTYFQTKGNGEIVRLALVAAGQKFEDERIEKEKWPKLKPDTPNKQLPLLTIKEKGNETVYCQSAACAKYIARKFGLFGSTPEESLLIDEVYECIVDVQREFAKVFYEPDESKKPELRKKIREEMIPRLNDYINKRTAKYGKNGYIIGPKMTLADIHLYNIVDLTSEWNAEVWEGFQDIHKHVNLVKSDKRIATWRDYMPK